MSTVLLLEVLGGVSLLTFIGSLIAVPWIINRMPVDFFVQHWQQLAEKRQTHPALTVLIFIGRNTLGLLLVAAGIAMLFLPGQGLLTILIGFCAMDFPGKQHLLQFLISKISIQNGLNWIRRKCGKQPFLFS